MKHSEPADAGSFRVSLSSLREVCPTHQINDSHTAADWLHRPDSRRTPRMHQPPGGVRVAGAAGESRSQTRREDQGTGADQSPCQVFPNRS